MDKIRNHPSTPANATANTDHRTASSSLFSKAVVKASQPHAAPSSLSSNTNAFKNSSLSTLETHRTPKTQESPTGASSQPKK